MSLVWYIVVMAGVTYLIRMLPLTLLQKKIENRFLRSFLYYVPYACLAAMTFPAILTATAAPVSAALALVVAILVALRGKGLVLVAVCACITVFVSEWLICGVLIQPF